MRNNGWHDGRFGKMSMLSAWMNGGVEGKSLEENRPVDTGRERDQGNNLYAVTCKTHCLTGDDFAAFARFKPHRRLSPAFGYRDFRLRAAFAPAFQFQQVAQPTCGCLPKENVAMLPHPVDRYSTHASSVFSISVATVIGPTPPGTGVMYEARLAASSNTTSPTTLPFSRRLMPTSITIAPSLIQSP